MTTKITTNNQTWTIEQLISLSTNLANVYGAVAKKNQGDRQQDEWTSAAFINLSQTLAQAYSSI
ncbi:MAG: hypothetical protein WBB82_17440 [Limnothrix sp.]